MRDYHPQTELLRERIILVTGSSQGIGRAVARAYASHGATVILLARQVDQLESLYDEIIALKAPKPAIYPFNLATATPKDYSQLAATLQQTFGRLDGLLHNAAILGQITPINQYDIRQWYSVMQTNLHAPFLLTQACHQLLKQSRDASLIFTEDGAAQQAYWGAYSVSKSGIKTLRQIIADELEHITTIRVNNIDPGPIRTKLRTRTFPAQDPKYFLTPDAILTTYLYLMGSDSQDCHGQCLFAQDTKDRQNIDTSISKEPSNSTPASLESTT